MKLILKDTTIWAQTATASAKIITFPTFHSAIHAIRWCGTFNNGETAGVALINYCNEKGLKASLSPISNSFGALTGMKANFHF